MDLGCHFVLIRLFYFAELIESYRAGDLGQVYPIERGAAPLMSRYVRHALQEHC